MSSQSSHLNSSFIRAGAGAGKTRALTDEVIKIVSSTMKLKNQFPNIAICTFTVKATQELKERLILASLDSGNKDIFEYVSQGSHLHISTIHGILSRFLKTYGHVIEFDTGFHIIDESETLKISAKVLRKVLEENSKNSLLLKDFGFQNLLELCLSYYEASFIEENLSLPTKDILLQQIHEKEIQIKETCQKLSQQIRNGLQAETQSKSKENWLILADSFESISKSDHVLQEIEKSVLRIQRFPTSSKKWIGFEDLSLQSKNLWADIKNFVNEPSYQTDFVEKLSSLNQELSLWIDLFVDELYQYKKKQAKLSIQDLELFSLMAIRENPLLAEAFSEEWDFWLIDEYQDTSPIQVKLLNAFIGTNKSFVVGDPQQSIYLFRGANRQVFSDRERWSHDQGIEIRTLMKNYRSSKDLMHFINHCFKPLGFEEMEAFQDKGNEKSVAEFFLCDSEESEYLAIAESVLDLLKAGVAAEEICVLSRTNKDLENLHQILKSHNIPSQLHTTAGFDEKREILDLKSFLLFLLNPYDDFNLMCLLRSPWFYVRDEELQKWIQNKDSKSYWHYFSQLDHPVIKALLGYKEMSRNLGYRHCLVLAMEERKFFDSLNAYDSSGLAEANVWKWIHQFSMREHSQRFQVLDWLRKDHQANLLEGESEAVSALEPKRVQLMSIHKSKGLQFSYVYLLKSHEAPNFTKVIHSKIYNGEFYYRIAYGEESKTHAPLALQEAQKRQKNEELMESARLLYVAMTRAKQKLHFTFQENIKKDSWLELLELDLNPGLRENNFFQYQVHYKHDFVFESKLSVEAKPKLRDFWSKTEIETDRLSVSELLESFETPIEEKAISELESEVFVKWKGTQKHKVFESLMSKDFQVESLEPDEKAAVDFIFSIHNLPIQEIFANARVEWGFQLRMSGQWLEGQIDLWSETESAIWVIDYKTGSIRYKDKAFQQLMIYAFAIASYKTNKKPIRMLALYPFSEKYFLKTFDQEELFVILPQFQTEVQNQNQYKEPLQD